MRVTIEHREEVAGLSGTRRAYFVDCEVLFSEEERAIIRERNLADSFIETESAIPEGSGIADYTWGNTGLRTLARLLVLAGFVNIPFSIAKVTPEPLSLLFWLGALGVFLYRKSAERTADRSMTGQRITVRALLQNPRFTVYAPNPAVASAHDASIRDQLAGLKNLIAASAELRAKQTFEL